MNRSILSRFHKRLIKKRPFPIDLLARDTFLDQNDTIGNEYSLDNIRGLSEMAVNLWLCKKRLIAAIGNDNNSAEKKYLRPIDNALENLESLGIIIKDFLGNRFVHGMAVNIVSSVPSSSVKEETIVETLKPTIYYRDRLFQIGDVIIEVPSGAGMDDERKKTNDKTDN